MRTFTLLLQDATRAQETEGVSSFVGEDASGSFGIQAGHVRFMSILKMGLARFRIGEDQWTYLASPGAVLYFRDNRLTISTRRFLLDNDYMRISRALEEQLMEEEAKLRVMKESLHQMDEAILRRLWEMGRRVTG